MDLFTPAPLKNLRWRPPLVQVLLLVESLSLTLVQEQCIISELSKKKKKRLQFDWFRECMDYLCTDNYSVIPYVQVLSRSVVSSSLRLHRL